MKIALVFALVVCVVAQEAPSNATASPELAVMAQVQSEQAITRQYIETLMKYQQAQMSIQAANYLLQASTAPAPAAADFEEEDSDFEELMDGEQVGQAANRMLFAYNMLYATKYTMIQAILKSADVQNEFWQDRAMQLYVQMAGESVPPQILQMVFVKLYRTNLETLKLSLQFQTISHHVSWLEDELDVWGSLQTEGSLTAAAVMVDQEDDLVRDRMFAFTAFNSFAQLDFQTFYFDLYLESMLGGGSLGGSLGAQAPAADSTAFVEEESTAKPFTDILATSSFGAGVNTQPYLFLKAYKFYHLLFQMYTANTGLNAAVSDHHAYGMLHDDTPLNDDLGESMSGMGDQLMSSYATNLMYASQMQYVASLYELFLLFAPVLGGSLGGSLGSLGASLGSV